MGQACGCTDSTITTKDEYTQGQHGSAPTNADGKAPQVQTKTVTGAANDKFGVPGALSNKTFESKSEEQMQRLQRLVVELDLGMVEEL